MPSRSTILWARSGCEVPENTLIFGILMLCLSSERLRLNRKNNPCSFDKLFCDVTVVGPASQGGSIVVQNLFFESYQNFMIKADLLLSLHAN